MWSLPESILVNPRLVVSFFILTATTAYPFHDLEETSQENYGFGLPVHTGRNTALGAPFQLRYLGVRCFPSVIDSTSSVFNTDTLLSDNDNIFGSIIVKHRNYVLTYHNNFEAPTSPDTHSDNLRRN
ncbi:hypothetical protein CLF_104436 [Clonorchis sinensis]|uniref:Uncharacterized protein n=1 Tax=Clonorchis sinensis TaxID=79923 RepID=G7YBN8_CLOSI|nr:hypothetical protein CLF_104436 [Clonorchis sinensis]